MYIIIAMYVFHFSYYCIIIIIMLSHAYSKIFNNFHGDSHLSSGCQPCQNFTFFWGLFSNSLTYHFNYVEHIFVYLISFSIEVKCWSNLVVFFLCLKIKSKLVHHSFMIFIIVNFNKKKNTNIKDLISCSKVWSILTSKHNKIE
jgi:hypothetical protein